MELEFHYVKISTSMSLLLRHYSFVKIILKYILVKGTIIIFLYLDFFLHYDLRMY